LFSLWAFKAGGNKYFSFVCEIGLQGESEITIEGQQQTLKAAKSNSSWFTLAYPSPRSLKANEQT
jgi:hypothetical protein